VDKKQTNNKTSYSKKPVPSLGLGLALGAALGIAIGNLSIGIGVGLVFGAGMSVSRRKDN
jgi:F0F1-type ATP synthase membrane subunit c/vacuolar-type H+-ATPase subunit K